jgi:hypothetical protein
MVFLNFDFFFIVITINMMMLISTIMIMKIIKDRNKMSEIVIIMMAKEILENTTIMLICQTIIML